MLRKKESVVTDPSKCPSIIENPNTVENLLGAQESFRELSRSTSKTTLKSPNKNLLARNFHHLCN